MKLKPQIPKVMSRLKYPFLVMLMKMSLMVKMNLMIGGKIGRKIFMAGMKINGSMMISLFMERMIMINGKMTRNFMEKMTMMIGVNGIKVITVKTIMMNGGKMV